MESKITHFKKPKYWILFLISYSLNTYAIADNHLSKSILTYPIVDTGLSEFFSNSSKIKKPKASQPFYGQDSHYQGHAPSYTDNQDGTITDNVTGLIWQKDMGSKMTYDQAVKKVKTIKLGGYSDWRIPSIKDLYSLIQFTGKLSRHQVDIPYIDTKYFKQPIGNTSIGEREIDAQTWSSSQYVGRTMRNDVTIFGVNFIDGRIKGYPKFNPRKRSPQTMYFRFVRGNKLYGKNNFKDNNNGTISDIATGLMWQQSDSLKGMDWQHALEYAENLTLAGYDDWRLPNAKELQSLVDYSRSPQTTNSPAINPLFSTTKIIDTRSKDQYPYFWTSTTHQDGPNPSMSAVYIAFGESLGKMHGRVIDVHGAGAQRSDPKTGNPSNYPQYFGPQGDLRIVFNYVRCVRNID